ncbi:MAG: uroporphyrinogen decarboxylase [Deltaproteobacteria bacterium]|nr:MAG: uroporphyrinogen decarboxylase [Deltaproteobacteria bacterium]
MRQPKTEPSHTFLRACFALPTEYTPIWIMRQAGRYLPEYQEVRQKVSFLELCQSPDLAAEVTLQPIDRFGLDAAILFSDILLPAAAMGMNLSFEGGPPKLDPPLRSRAEIEALAVPDPVETLGYVMDAVREIRRRLHGRVPLIGFAGAPLTLASYMVEGGGSKNFIHLKTLMYTDAPAWRLLMEKIADTTAAYLNAQIEAGAQAVQLFDSWAGILSPDDFREFALPWVVRLIEQLDRDDVPVIYYVGESATLLEAMVETGADVLGIDWRIPMQEARRRIAGRAAVQGNLDPCRLFSPVPQIEAKAKQILDEAGPAPGHVFNLGHGILPPTDPAHVQALVDFVHRYSRTLRQ